MGWVILKAPWKRGPSQAVLYTGRAGPHGSSACPALLQPLPEMEYNGNPESVGYKIKYSRADGHGKTLSHVVQDRVEREYTIEDLEEWTEYRVQVQAFNAIGSGPWSHTVMGRTRESGTAPLCQPPSRSPRPAARMPAHHSPHPAFVSPPSGPAKGSSEIGLVFLLCSMSGQSSLRVAASPSP